MPKNISITIDKTGESGVPSLPRHIQETLAKLKAFTESVGRRRLYKYTAAEHAHGLLATGSLRIGTLNYYRCREAEDSLRGDLSEGTAAFLDAPSGMQTNDTLSPVTREWFTIPDGAIFRNNVWRTHSTVSDRFVFCLSSELSRTAAGTYDSCVEIADALGFVGMLTAVLNDAVAQPANEAETNFAPITYLERELAAEYHGYLSPAFLKEPRFEIEQEVRIVWETPRPQGYEYIDLKHAPMIKFVRQVDIPA